MSDMPELVDVFIDDHADVTSFSHEYHGSIMDVVVDEFSLDGVGSMKREYIVHDDAVAILPIRMGDNGDEEVLLIRQYRHPIRHIMWEIPAGLLDVEGETAELAAHRELGEEVDMVAGSLEPLINMYATPGCSDEQYMIFIARDVHASDVVFDRQDEEAEIESFWVPLSRVCQAIYAGDLRSPTLVTAILAYIGKQSVFLNGSK